MIAKKNKKGPKAGKTKKPGADRPVEKPRRTPLSVLRAIGGFFVRNKAFLGRLGIVLLALLVTALPLFFVNNVIGYLPLLAVVLIILVSYVYLRVLMRSLEFTEDSLADYCERGTDIDFVVTFKNKSILPFLRLEPYFYISDLFGDLDVVMPATLPLMPRETRDFSFNAEFEHLGTYSAGVKKIVIYDLLGLFSHTIENPNRHEVDVLPKLFDVSRVDLLNVAVQESQRSLQPIVTDDMDYAGVREYAPGDPLKTIHWKLSSRNPEGVYYTRLFETFGNPGLGIVVDSASPAYDKEQLMYIFDGVIESAISVNEYARDQGIDSEVIYYNKEGERTVRRLSSLEESNILVSDIPRIHVDSDEVAVDLYSKETNSLYGHGNLALCTAWVSEAIVTALIEAKMRNRNPLLFVVVPKGMEKDERKEFLRPLRRLEDAGIIYYAVSSAGELGEGEE